MVVFNYEQFTLDVITKRFDMISEQKRIIGLREISKEVKVSAATLSRILNGGKPDLDTVLLISRWLEKDISEYVLNEVKNSGAGAEEND